MQTDAKSIKHYRWHGLRNESGTGPPYFYDVGIEPDGGVYNPHGYPEEAARAAALRADERKAAKIAQNRAAGAVKRRQRREKRIYDAAKHILEDEGVGQLERCYCCTKGLSDPESMRRGIGSECWQKVLDAVAELQARDRAVAQ
jgi:hypothetical protein